MCHLIGRPTGTGTPPPFYYVHLAREPSRYHEDFNNNVSDTSSMTGGNPTEVRAGTQSPYQSHRSGTQAVKKPRPRNSKLGIQSTPLGIQSSHHLLRQRRFQHHRIYLAKRVTAQKNCISERTHDGMAGLSKTERAKLFVRGEDRGCWMKSSEMARSRSKRKKIRS